MKGRARRVRALVRKEFLQIVRDPSSIAIAFFMPVMLLVLFGFGVNLDARHVPVAVVMEQPSPEAMDFVAALRNSRYFAPGLFPSRPAAKRALREEEVRAIVVLREDFARHVHAGDEAPIQAILSGTDSNTAQLVSGYLTGAWQTWLVQRGLASGVSVAPVIEVDSRVWFNPEVRSQNFLVPGLVAIIMMLIGALLTALVVAREWERGTMEALVVSPVSEIEILLGKLIPYFILGLGGLALSVVMAIFVFDVPFRGSLGVLVLVSSVYLLAALGLGLVISAVTRNQFLAAQMAIVATFLPAFMLSGFIFDISSMSEWVRAFTYVVPARYFVAIVQTLFLAGDEWSVILPNVAAMVLMAAVFLALARRKTRKTLE